MEQRKQEYKQCGIHYYRPWIFLISDGEPTDAYASAVQALQEGQRRKNFEFFAVGVKGANMEATSKGWSERRNVIGRVLKFGLLIQRVRIPPGQSVDPQAGSEPCSGTGNCPVDA